MRVKYTLRLAAVSMTLFSTPSTDAPVTPAAASHVAPKKNFERHRPAAPAAPQAQDKFKQKQPPDAEDDGGLSPLSVCDERSRESLHQNPLPVTPIKLGKEGEEPYSPSSRLTTPTKVR